MITETIITALFEHQDLKYRDFHSRLVPDIDKEKIIGVRVPELKKLANEFKDREDIELFLNDLPHKYYEETNLHGFIVSKFADYEKAVKYIDKLLPYVDNWATCDLLRPITFKNNKQLLRADIDRWVSSDLTFTKRFGIEMAMVHFLEGDSFDKQYLSNFALIRSEEYYIKMMVAWYFATALAKQWESTIVFLEKKKLDKWTHNKTIQKALESYRITAEQKEYLRKLKIKNNC